MHGIVLFVVAILSLFVFTSSSNQCEPSVFEVKHFEPLRYTNYTTFSDLYHGDTDQCHIFNPKTGSYKLVKIGFHSNVFNCAIPPKQWFTLDFEQHDERDAFAFIGATSVYSPGIGNMYFVSKEEAINKFPQHEGKINEIYDVQHLG